MLDEQFFSDSTFGEHVNNNFVAIYALRGEPIYDELKKAYNTSATPTVVIAEAGGAEIDRIIGYGPPPEGFLTKVTNAANRIDTFEALIKAHEENPEDLETTFKLAYKYERNKRDSETAAELYKEIVDRGGEAKDIMVPYRETPDDLISIYEWSLYQLARISYNYNYYETLINEFLDSRFSHTAYMMVAPSISIDKSPDEVIEFYEKMVEKYPDDANLIYWYISYCAENKTNIDRGIEVAEMVRNLIAKSNSINDPMGPYAELLMLKGDSTKANQLYGRYYIDRKIDDLVIHMIQYAHFWESRNKNLESAQKTLEQIVSLDPENLRNRMMVADSYARRGKLDEAIRVYGAEHISRENISTRDLSQYVNFWAEQKANLESALEAALRYKEMTSGDGYRSTLAKVYLAMDKTDEALKEYGPDYIKEHGSDAYTLSDYAKIWAEAGKNLESALEAAQKAVELEPEAYYSLDALSYVYWKMGKYKEALEAAEKGLELAPGHVGLLKRIEDVKKDMIKKKGECL